MEEAMKKPGVLKAAMVILLVSTICGFSVALLALATLFGGAAISGFDSTHTGDNLIPFIAILIASIGGMAIHGIGFSGWNGLKKDRRRGLRLSRFWAIAIIVLSGAAIASNILRFALMVIGVFGPESAETFGRIAISMTRVNAVCQLAAAITVLIFMGLKPVKEYLKTITSSPPA